VSVVVLWVVTYSFHLQAENETLKLEAILPSETLITTYMTARRYNPGDNNRQLHSHENLLEK
jgi:hypothetical protein